jgi:putative ABC transport system permease protein
MNLLRLITLPYVRQHSLRCLLTLVGIMLGVTVFVAMHTANQSVLAGFRNTVVRIAGRAQLQVSAGEAGFEEEVLDRVRNTPGVERAAPVIEAVVQTGLQGEGNLLILAVDMVGDAGLRDYTLESGGPEVVDDPLVFLAQPDSLILTRDFAERNRLQSNSKLLMQTMEGQKEFTVRGLLRPSGMTSAYGGNLAIMDIYAAQQVFGRGRSCRGSRCREDSGVAAPRSGSGSFRGVARQTRPEL